jgi:hypothetical protein
MIETITKYFCDSCTNEIEEGGELYKLSREKVDTSKRIEHATKFLMHTDGIVMKRWDDEYPAHHLCQACVTKVEDLINQE